MMEFIIIRFTDTMFSILLKMYPFGDISLKRLKIIFQSSSRKKTTAEFQN